MVEKQERFEAAIAAFDAANAEDPNQDVVEGVQVPSALIYGQRMSARLDRMAPDASDALRLAIRAQHLRRWAIARDDYPKGIKGYNQWRRAMALYHAEHAGVILEPIGYDSEQIERVQFLLRKEGRTKDAEAQQLEDVACLVFLEHYFSDFIVKYQYDDEKVIDIVRKTWRKMSSGAHEAATQIPFPPREADLVGRALAD